VSGQVQGVGFRPFVYRLAMDEQLTGWVLNDAAGVRLEVQGSGDAVDRFVRRLQEELPPLASIASCQAEPAAPAADERTFEIRPSSGGELTDADVTVDAATCEACLRELRDPADPRYRYPMINCTNCGPRYSIVRRIPYDRPNTTMTAFAMCPLCAAQYETPADRRFHAQPVACPTCGPTVELADAAGRPIAADDPFAEAARRLAAAEIVAVKALGGYQLCCRADDEAVVERLRERKRRDAKPFAMLVADLAAARELCEVDDASAALLAGPVRPIVLLPRRADAPVATAVADDLPTLGLMLPSTPVHVLLLDALAEIGQSVPLVATSGNIADEPLIKDGETARDRLGGIADVFLTHNRPIEHRVDDSVVQTYPDGRSCVIRRARGYAPQPIRLAGLVDAPPILAVGAELKNTVCLLSGGRAVLSPHVGDLTDGRTYRHFVGVIDALEALFEVRPAMLAADAHPQYMSSEYAARRHRGDLPDREPLPVTAVQHHHAHIVSCMAEHGRGEPVIGLACDGVGYGDDGAVWGGEVLLARLDSYERLGHLRYLPLIGGDAAATETWRPALAALVETFGDDAADWAERLHLPVEMDRVAAALDMLTAGVNCPAASSLGRWFDAVAALAGLADANRYEGQAPMLLEAAVGGDAADAYAFAIDSQGSFEMDLRPMVEQMAGEIATGAAAGVVAGRFHNTIAEMLLAAAKRAADQSGLRTVALSGGCFLNRVLTDRLAGRLAEAGLEVLRHETIPCNDGGVALGQAVVAATKAVGV